MATIVAAAGGGNWSATGTWTGGVVPTAADDVQLGSTSGNVTIDVAAACRSLNCTGYTGILTQGAVTLSVGTSTVNASNLAFKLVSGMTANLNVSGAVINFVSTSATVQTIDCGGKTLRTVGFNGVGGSWQLTSAMANDSSASITFTNGTLNTNGQACSWGLPGLGAGTKTLTLGASVITIVGTGLNFNTNSAGFTLNAGTSSLVFNPTAGVTPSFSTGSFTYYDVSVIRSSGGFAPTDGNPTFHNFTMDNTVLGGGNRVLQFDNGATVTINGTLTYKANSASNRGRMTIANSGSTPSTIALGTTGVLSITDADIEDTTVTGTNTPVSAAGGRIADGGGNSGFAFPSPVTYYWVGNAGAMSDGTHYSTSSGGAAGSLVPLIHDTLVFDSNSITIAGQNIAADVMRMPGIDFTNVLNNPTFNPRNPSGAGNAIYGSLILKAGMSYSLTGAAGSFTSFSLRGRGNYILDQAGIDLTANTSINVTAPNGKVTIASDLTLSNTEGLTISTGTFDANGHNVTMYLLSSSNTFTRTINMGSGTWTLTGTGNIWQTPVTTGLTLNIGTSVIICNYSGATGTRTFNQGNSVLVPKVRVTAGSDTFSTNASNGFFANDLDFTGFTGVWNIGTNTLYQSLILGAGMSTITGVNTLTFAATDSRTITSNGVAIASTVTFNGVGGTWTLQDDFVMSDPTRTMKLTNGALIANNKNVTCGVFDSNNSNVRTLNMGSGTWTLTGTGAGNVWNLFTITNLTFSGASATVVVSAASTSARVFDGGGQTYKTLTYTVAGSTGSLRIGGANTFTNINFSDASNARTLILPASLTTTIVAGGTFNVIGTAGNLMSITSSSAGTQAILSRPSDVISCDYLSIQDSAAGGGSLWFAGRNSTSVSNNTGWQFVSQFDIAATPAGAASVAAGIGNTAPIAAAPAGAAAVSGVLGDQTSLSASVAAAAAVTANMVNKTTLAGSTTGSGTMAAAIMDVEPIVANIFGQATTTADIKNTVVLQQSLSGAAQVQASFPVQPTAAITLGQL